MPELALDHHERDTFVRHLDRVCVAQLVWREAASDARRGGCVMQLLACGRCFPASAGGRAVDHAQERSDRELASDLEPGVELLPCPAVHPDFAALAAFPVPNEHGAAATVQVALLEGERFTDAQPGTPQQDDQRAKPVSVGTVTDCAHDSDDLLDGRWIGRVLLALVAWWAPAVIAGHRRRRAAMACGVQQNGFHESSLGWSDSGCYSNRPTPGREDLAATRA
jgi:hypothetical protein